MTVFQSPAHIRLLSALLVLLVVGWWSHGCHANFAETPVDAETSGISESTDAEKPTNDDSATGKSRPPLADAPQGPQLDLQTERVIVFKDGYALIVKRGVAVTDENGEVYTDNVPDAAVLGSFWATPKEGRLKAMVAGWVEEKTVDERVVACTQVIEILKANVGKKCWLTLPDDSSLSGVIQRVLAHETTAPMTEALRPAFERHLRSNLSSVRSISSSVATAQLSHAVSGVTGSHFVLRTDHGDVLLAVSEVRRLTVEDMTTDLARTVTTTKKTKRLTFRFAEPGQRRELLIAFFRPGLRWIPTYRVNLSENEDKKKFADIAMQAELLNETEDLIDTSIDIVVGVPNFRFRTVPSPFILEQTLRNALNRAAPQIMGQFRNDMSNALFTQRRAEVHRPVPQQPVAQPGTSVELPSELTAARAQELFVYNLGRHTLRKSERAAIPVLSTRAPYRDIHTWDLHWKRHDISTAPSGSGVKSPLVLSKNQVWRQIELTNTTDMPWTTGAAMIMQGNQPLAQELLTYTSPKGICRVPVTVAIDVRGSFSESETGRQLKALSWDGYSYAKISQHAKLTLQNQKTEAVDVQITLRFGGRAEEASHDGQISLSPYRAEDWENYRGSSAVNNSSTVYWRAHIKPGETFQPTVDYHFYTRH